MNGSPSKFCSAQYLMKIVMMIETIKVAASLFVDSYEEKDFSCYFEQSQAILSGEMDYSQVSSRAGPLVYPAMSTYINILLYKFVGSEGTYFRPVQVINGLTYLV